MTRRVLAVVTATAIGAAGCGGNHGTIGKTSSPKRSTPAPPPPPAPAPTDNAASGLRASLTALLTDHVYLSGVAVAIGLGSGFGSPAAKAAAATVDRNSADLATLVSSAYGAAAAAQFTRLWRTQLPALAAYAKARARGNAKAAHAAVADLGAFRLRLAAFLARHNPNLPEAVVAAGLQSQVVAVLRAVDAAARKSAAGFARVQQAAGGVPSVAEPVAAGIVKQFPKKYPGAADDAPATLRADLTSLLVSHVDLAGIAIVTGIDSGLGSPAFAAAAAALDRNSVALSKTIESLYGMSAAHRFLTLWRAHIGFFIDYAKAQLARRRAAAEQALARLDGYRQSFGQFIASVNPNLTASAVAAALKPHIETLTATIRAAVKKSPKTFDRLRDAAMHMPATADVLAAAVAKQFPDRFPPA
jgi:hypothetical protein